MASQGACVMTDPERRRLWAAVAILQRAVERLREERRLAAEARTNPGAESGEVIQRPAH